MIRLTLIIAVCLQASHPLLAEDGKASVRVEVRSVHEQALNNARIELFQQDKKTRVDVTFRNSVATGVLYRSYIPFGFIWLLRTLKTFGEAASAPSQSPYYGQCNPLRQRPVAGLESAFFFPRCIGL
jgi:hypothetical protein